ncbi:hypothetical protein BDR06DRAFT_508092 [Suillus hirtellus]|nr:hypothetical protein BDR06DRAFT_508092 [Suillus hirtellus]
MLCRLAICVDYHPTMHDVVLCRRLFAIIRNNLCSDVCHFEAFGICMVYVQAPTTNAKNVFGNQTGHWITVFLSLTLATNLLSSGLLAYLIWTIERNVSGAYATKKYMPILRVLIDAALLYSAVLWACLYVSPYRTTDFMF